MSTPPVSRPPTGGPGSTTPAPVALGGTPPVARAALTEDHLEAEVALVKGEVADGVDLELFSASTAVAVESFTPFGGGNSVTGGLSVGVGAELGVGTRDFDKDNNPELCARVSVLFFTLGACVENPL